MGNKESGTRRLDDIRHEGQILREGVLTDEMRNNFRDSATEPILTQHEVYELNVSDQQKKRLLVLTSERLYLFNLENNTTKLDFEIAQLEAMIKSTQSNEVVLIGPEKDLRFKGLSQSQVEGLQQLLYARFLQATEDGQVKRDGGTLLIYAIPEESLLEYMRSKHPNFRFSNLPSRFHRVSQEYQRHLGSNVSV